MAIKKTVCFHTVPGLQDSAKPQRELLSLGSLPLSHLGADISIDAPDEGEAAEGDDGSQHGEASDHGLDAGDGVGSLYGVACLLVCASLRGGVDVIERKQMQLFVMPVTSELLYLDNTALKELFPFAIENHIPVLPLMQESGLDKVFNEKCGDLQFLDKNANDITAIKTALKTLKNALLGNFFS